MHDELSTTKKTNRDRGDSRNRCIAVWVLPVNFSTGHANGTAAEAKA
jgi:hypothetical protein